MKEALVASEAFNNAFGGDWLQSLNGLDSQKFAPVVQKPIQIPYQAGAIPITNADVLGTDWSKTLPSALTGGAAGDASIAGALDRYTASLGKMKTGDWINAGLGGVQTIGGLIGAFGSLGLANKQFNLSKRMAETNLTNSVQAYNTALEDKARSRAVMEGTSAADTAAYIASHKATTGN
jgi:hypothetical protein